jgi:hypothetical protein
MANQKNEFEMTDYFKRVSTRMECSHLPNICWFLLVLRNTYDVFLISFAL